MNRRKKKQINSLLSTVFGWIFSLIVLIPFAVILINSFKNEREAVSMSLSFPKEGWIWDNYRIVIREGNMLRAFFNSLLLSCMCVLICITISAMAALSYTEEKRCCIRPYFIFFLQD